MEELSNFNDQLEKRNFLTWLNYATTEEILKAMINHKEKFKYLLDKYKADVDSYYQQPMSYLYESP